MKVLLPLYQIQDLGGIINWVEHLCHGMKTLGAEVTLVRLEDKEQCVERIKAKRTGVGNTGLAMDQRAGWAFPLTHRVPLRAVNWQQYTTPYDLVIWVVPVPSEANLFDDWERLYDIATPQVMVIHDGNLNDLYPHAYEVMPKCCRVVGVHDCAYNSISHKIDNRCLIPNPQILTNDRMKPVRFAKREQEVFSLQTFKRWKRVDDLIRAVPHINGKVFLAGGGIEYYYMTSAGKRKACYGRIWEEAISAGMSYLGYIPESVRDECLSDSKLLIDPSWSKKYATYGSHFNRTFVDAIIAGCMPAGRGLMYDGNSYFPKDLYVTIPYDATPIEFAAEVNTALDLSEREYTQRVDTMQKIVIENFHSVVVAKQYLQFAK